MNIHLDNRSFLTITGEDRYDFLQGLITNDIFKVEKQGLIYSCLLTPQGKYLFDFFIFEHDGALVIDCFSSDVEILFKKLRMFTLRSHVKLSITPDIFYVIAVLNSDKPTDEHCYHDPRHEDMGYRFYSIAKPENLEPLSAYQYHRYGLTIAEGASELIQQKTTMLEANMDVTGAVDFDKGCYMGQELTARTHYRGLVKKRYMSFQCDDRPDVGMDITNDSGKLIGDVRAFIAYDDKGRGIALMRLDAEPKDKIYTVNGMSLKF